MFKEINKGLYIKTSSPKFGNQDVGISPAGAMDRFSYLTGNIILGNREDSEALEIIFPPLFQAIEDGYFILTGAPCTGSFISRDDKKINIKSNKVYSIKQNDQLTIGQKDMGFRTYLCYRKSCDVNNKIKLEGRERGSYKKAATWPAKDKTIRVIKGPEYKYLENPELLINNHWVVSNETSNMGMKLKSNCELKVNMPGNMVSEAVADGTIQITSTGPIILLRHRQTVGGYPRGYNVIQADVDKLAQYMPGQIIRFSLVTIDQALDAAKNMNNDLNRLRDKYMIKGVI